MPVLGVKHKVVMAMVDNIPVAVNYCLHAQIIAQNSRYVNGGYWLGLPTPRPKRSGAHIPMSKGHGVLRAGVIKTEAVGVIPETVMQIFPRTPMARASCCSYLLVIVFCG